MEPDVVSVEQPTIIETEAFGLPLDYQSISLRVGLN